MKTYNQQLKNQFEIKSGQAPDNKEIRKIAIINILLFIAITVIIACLIMQIPSHCIYNDIWSWVASIAVGIYGALCVFSWFDGGPSTGGY